MRVQSFLLVAFLLIPVFGGAAEPPPAEISSVTLSNNQIVVGVKPHLGADAVEMLTTTNLGLPFVTNGSVPPGYKWTNTTTAPAFFSRAKITPISQERLLTAIAMNRLAYGPTPYDLVRVLGTNAQGEIGGPGATGGIGIDAWINEQLDPTSTNITALANVTNQFSLIAPIFSRFGFEQDIILTNSTATNSLTPPGETNGPGTCNFHDFKAWYTMHAVGAPRQLLEVLCQFIENHFVTQWSKSTGDFFNGKYNNVPNPKDIALRLATQMEYLEHLRVRNALLNPACTFSNLLTIQAESCAQIIYLDTNDSQGQGANVANENYSREIMELYSMGVDNGYDQGDITAMAPAWTGWDCHKVAVSNVFNVFARMEFGALVPNGDSNNIGVFSFQYRWDRHGNNLKRIFYNRTANGTGGNNANGTINAANPKKSLPARFKGTNMVPAYDYTAIAYPSPTTDPTYGANAAGQYSLYLPARAITGSPPGQVNGGVNGIKDGYDIVRHLADLPFTQEFLCVKLCRLLVHDDFEIGYDFSDGVVTPEEQLVWNCMLAWQTNSPQGQIYKIIRVITDSDLFRSQDAYARKIKTPFEFTISAIRALRYSSNGTFNAGTFSANTDGYSISAGFSTNAGFNNTTHPLNRMGRFLLFDREEPDGYPETGTVYVSAGALTERNRWIHSVLNATPVGDGITGGNNTRTDPFGLMKLFVQGTGQNDATNVASFFVNLLFPGEGAYNVALYRQQAITLLDTSDAGAYSAGSYAAAGSATKDTRVRRMVAMLMSLPRFNEQ